MSSLIDTCPRCGGTVVFARSSGPVTVAVKCGGCDHGWGSLKMFDRECIARDLAGTKAVRIGPEYLDPAESANDNVRDDLKELVALVELTTLEHVAANVLAAIEGRRTPEYMLKNGKERTGCEIEALTKMLNWLHAEEARYGDNYHEM